MSFPRQELQINGCHYPYNLYTRNFILHYQRFPSTTHYRSTEHVHYPPMYCDIQEQSKQAAAYRNPRNSWWQDSTGKGKGKSPSPRQHLSAVPPKSPGIETKAPTTQTRAIVVHATPTKYNPGQMRCWIENNKRRAQILGRLWLV